MSDADAVGLSLSPSPLNPAFPQSWTLLYPEGRFWQTARFGCRVRRPSCVISSATPDNDAIAKASTASRGRGRTRGKKEKKTGFIELGKTS